MGRSAAPSYSASKAGLSSWLGGLALALRPRGVHVTNVRLGFVDTKMAKAVPWGVRVFLGTNVRRLGFSINYQRIAENVWFPATYGTEFHVDVLWGYKRTITLALESADFKKTGADSTIHYDPPQL